MLWGRVAICAMATCGALGGGNSAVAGETVTYSYDTLGRLGGVSSTGSVNNGQNVAIAYDAAGNRINYSSNVSGRHRRASRSEMPVRLKAGLCHLQ